MLANNLLASFPPHSPFSILEVLESNVLDVFHQVVVAGVNCKLPQDLNLDQAEDELHRQVPSLLYCVTLHAPPCLTPGEGREWGKGLKKVIQGLA